MTGTYDPVQTAWMAAGSPAPAGGRSGQCARCLTPGADHQPVTTVVSENFTAFTDWLGNPAGGLCPACAWVYRTPALRATTHLVTRDPARLTPLSRTDLATYLGRTLGPDEALTVPIRAGRKHVLSTAAWGHIAVDDIPIRWTLDDATRLEALIRLRTLGATHAQLRAAAPAWTLISATTPAERGTITTDWAALQPWRTRTPWMDLALLATTPARHPTDSSRADR